MRKGFFLLLELIIALLIFSSVYVTTHSFITNDNSSFILPEITCTDLLSLWLLGENDLSSIASEILPISSVSFSSAPIFSVKVHSTACFAQRMHNGVVESLYILIEW